MRKNQYPSATGHKGKGGFTLVELVVVIAIIAIIAAIAIPAVVGIVDHAAKTSEKTAANDIDGACMEYKTGIIWGVINSSTSGNSTQDDLPPEKAAYATKVSAAKAATVQNALEYAGITSYTERINSGSFVYNSEGRIFSKMEYPDLTDVLALDTTLEELYY